VLWLRHKTMFAEYPFFLSSLTTLDTLPT